MSPDFSNAVIRKDYQTAFRMLEEYPAMGECFDRLGRSLLTLAVESGWPVAEFRKLFTSKIGPDSDGRFQVSALYFAEVNRDRDLSAFLRSRGWCLSPFEMAMISCRRGEEDIAIDIVESSPEVFDMCDPYGKGILHNGIIFGLPRLVSCCLDNKISPDMRLLEGPLPMDLVDGDFTLSKLLIDAGASVEEINIICEVTPLFYAIKSEAYDTLALFLSYGVSSNGKVPGGGTILDYCIKAGKTKAIAILIEFGAQLSARDRKNSPEDQGEIVWIEET